MNTNKSLWKLELMPHTNKVGKHDEMVLVTDLTHPKVHNYLGLIHVDSFLGNDEVYEKLEKGESVLVKLVVVNEEG